MNPIEDILSLEDVEIIRKRLHKLDDFHFAKSHPNPGIPKGHLEEFADDLHRRMTSGEFPPDFRPPAIQNAYSNIVLKERGLDTYHI